jgi:hypothetical protein
MWRTLAILVVLVAGIGAWQKYGGSHGFGALAAQPVYEGFWELRMKLQAGSRDFEMVAVGDRPLVKECEGGLTHFELSKFCTPANHCTLQPLQCEHEVAPRYQHMLDQQPASLHYVHLSGDTPEGARRAVVVGWGMTEDESSQVCKGLRETMSAKDSAFKISCI